MQGRDGLEEVGDQMELCAHRRALGQTGVQSRGRSYVRRVTLVVLAVAGACAVASVMKEGERSSEMLGWMNFHGDGQLGYSGLRTTVPSEVMYKTPTSATPLYIPGEGVRVAPYPMPYTGVVHRARPFVMMQHPAIRLSTTTSFSDSPSAPLEGSPLGTLAAGSMLPAMTAPAAVMPAQVVMPGQTVGTIWNSYPSYLLSATILGSLPGATRWLKTPYQPQMMATPPAYMDPQFLGMVPVGVSSPMLSTEVSGAGYVPQPGIQQAAAYDARTSYKLQRGFVPVRVAFPRPALPFLPKVANPFAMGPQMAYDANNVNAGIYEGINDINPSLGLPAIPRDPVTVTSTTENEDEKEEPGQEGNSTDASSASQNSTAASDETSSEKSAHPLSLKLVQGRGSDVVLPAGLAVPICETQLVIIDNTRPASDKKAPCETLDKVKKDLGAASYAALEEIIDAQALLEDKKQIILALPEGGHMSPR